MFRFLDTIHGDVPRQNKTRTLDQHHINSNNYCQRPPTKLAREKRRSLRYRGRFGVLCCVHHGYDCEPGKPHLTPISEPSVGFETLQDAVVISCPCRERTRYHRLQHHDVNGCIVLYHARDSREYRYITVPGDSRLAIFRER